MKTQLIILLLIWCYVQAEEEDERPQCLDKKKFLAKKQAFIQECKDQAGPKSEPDYKKKFKECAKKAKEDQKKEEEDMKQNFTEEKFKKYESEMDEYILDKKDDLVRFGKECFESLKDEEGKIPNQDDFKACFKEKFQKICRDEI